MAKFVKGNALNAALENIFEKAEKKVVIVSPYIKLHSRFIDVLRSKLDNPKLNIIVVFGKNEGNLSKSFSNEDFNFLKSFPNIEIKHEPRLHAKYYANESSALLSSMNLYDFSQDKNIEFGILTSVNLLDNLTGNVLGDSIDKEAYTYFDMVIRNSPTLFKRTPVFEDRLMGLQKKYMHSTVEVDELSAQLEVKNKVLRANPSNNSTVEVHMGYCIRTGERIPFNVEKPMSAGAFKSWNKFKDADYKEKYCHFSGEDAQGETSMAKPILKKNWSKAKKFIKS